MYLTPGRCSGFMRFHAQRRPLGGTGGPLHGCRRSRGPRSWSQETRRARWRGFVRGVDMGGPGPTGRPYPTALECRAVDAPTGEGHGHGIAIGTGRSQRPRAEKHRQGQVRARAGRAWPWATGRGQGRGLGTTVDSRTYRQYWGTCPLYSCWTNLIGEDLLHLRLGATRPDLSV